jgi:hypothetical protein
MVYRCVATSVAGFVQQLAVAYVSHGYYFYVAGMIPEDKDPAKTDEKILRQYGIAVSKWTRARRKRAGQANVHYLRHGHFYVIIANHGEHPFFAAEGKRVRDIRKAPILFMGYSVGCRRERGGGKYHAGVRINREHFRQLKRYFERAAIKKSVEEVTADLRGLLLEPYAPVRDQLKGILRAVNRKRKLGALPSVPREALRFRRAPVQPFLAQSGGQKPKG